MNVPEDQKKRVYRKFWGNPYKDSFRKPKCDARTVQEYEGTIVYVFADR